MGRPEVDGRIVAAGGLVVGEGDEEVEGGGVPLLKVTEEGLVEERGAVDTTKFALI